jgi:hypothetical protein
MPQQQSNLETVFAAYTNLNPTDRASFKLMLGGYEFKSQVASNAGRKAAEWRKKHAASGSPATGAA